MSSTRLLGTILSISISTGCAHGLMRGSVAMKGDNQEAHVCMGDKEVKAGDRVSLFKNVCTGAAGFGSRTGEAGGIDCSKVKLGQGTVKRTLNEHYSIVTVDPGVQFQEGTVVEKE